MSFGILASQGAGAGGGSGNSAYATAVMQDSPLVFLQFDETSGTVAADSSGNGRDGSYDNSPYLGMYSVIPGSSGRSARFENGSGGSGPKQQGNVPYGGWVGVSEVTVTFPCFLPVGNYRLIATRYGEPGNDWSWFVYINVNTVQFHYRSSGGVNTNIDTGFTPQQGIRYFIAAYTDCQVVDNMLSGINYVILNFGEKAGSTNIVVTGNKVTTRWFTSGGVAGVEQTGPNPPAWGSNGNVKSNNTWADDYGTGGNGTGTPLASRQYPLGNGPRVGTTAF